jgi:hypothetical protein
LIELINTGIIDDVGRRRAGRRLDDITDAVFERLRPLVRRRDGGLPDHEITAAVTAVADTLDAADLSDPALFADNVDPVLIAARLRRELPDAPARAGLSETGIRLYEQVLSESCVCLTQLVVQLGPFQARATVNVIGRLTAAADSLAQILDRVPVTSLDAPAGDRHFAKFGRTYLSHILPRLDVLELFGVDVHRYRLHTKLSIAYISLSVSGADSRRVRRGPRWDPGRFRRNDGGADTTSVRAEQALGSAERVLLRGDAGSGKTTLLQWIAVTAARQGFTGDLASWNGRIPFMIRLRDYVRQPLPAPERFLDRIAATVAGLMPAGWVHRQLDMGAILLVDGVDEVPESQRREVRQWLQDLLRRYQDLRLVVTSRPAAASDSWLRPERFSSVFLERMSPADIKALIRHWHDAVRRSGDLPCEPHRLPSYEQRLLAQLDGSAHLHNLAASPLLCAMLCALNLDRDSNLPRNRMDLYQAAVDMLLERRDEKRGVPATMPGLTSRDQLQLLQAIAWWMTQNSRTEAARNEAEKEAGERLAGIRHITAAAANVLDHMIQRSGILREPVPGRIDFVHRTFQEYLAAREAADRALTGPLLDHAHLDTWRETIILAAGCANAPTREQILAGLLTAATKLPKQARRLRLLAAACIETAPAVEPEQLDAIRSHLRGLVPRSIAEARSLAAVGEPLLSELPADPGALTEAQAAATVRAAALVNGPAAMTALARYATDPRVRVQRELISCWEYFDPMDYADAILADAPLLDGHVTINSVVPLPALSRLHRLTRTSVYLNQRLDLQVLSDVPHLTDVAFDLGSAGDLEMLAEHPELAYVNLSADRQHLDLRVLAALPNLTDVFLRDLATDQDLAPLTGLDKLTSLGVAGVPVTREVVTALPALAHLTIAPPSPWDPEILKQLSGLQRLNLTDAAEPLGGIERLADQLGRFTGLVGLTLWNCPWVMSLEPLAHLTALTNLDLDNTSVADLAPLSHLRRLQWLYLGNTEHVLDLTPLATLPELKDLWITDPAPGIDLSPLRGKRTTVYLSKKIQLSDPARPDRVRIKRF